MKTTDSVKLDYERERDNGMGSEIKDNFHTMSELYFNRMVLFSVLCGIVNKGRKKVAWRSKNHHPDDGPSFEGFFIVGINTPEGTYAYHYDNKYWSYFGECETLEHAPMYDGHRSSDIGRLYSLLK